jgi:hypothetical protein
MFGGDFGEKCIIVQFLGGRKRRKSALTQRRRERFQEEQILREAMGSF